MKKYRIKGMDRLTNCEQIVNNCVDTVDGLEHAHINLETGEITYSKGTCSDSSLIDAFKTQGVELEETK